MKVLRQHIRRELFEQALTTMPCFETWDVEIPIVTPQYDPDLIDADLLALYPHPNKVIMGGSVTIDEHGKAVKKQDFKSIPRRTRRSMARALSHRQWQAMQV